MIFLKKVLNGLKKIFKEKKKIKKQIIRTVYFGLRLKFLGFLFLTLSTIIFLFTFVFYLDLRILLKREKEKSAAKLTQALKGPAEFYLDRTKYTTNEELKEKYNFIDREAKNFMNFDKDIVKIWLVDNKLKVVFSTYKGDEGKNYGFSYFIKALEQEAEKLFFKTFSIRNNITGKKEKFMAISYPIFLSYGEEVEILKDFEYYYKEFYNRSFNTRKNIYLILWKKYQHLLSEEFNPYDKKNGKSVFKAWDIDFLFLNLFINMVRKRQWNIKRSEAYLWKEDWLLEFKKKQAIADERKDLKLEVELSNKIADRLTYLKNEVKNFTKLGVLAILYNINNVNNELNRYINVPFALAIIFLIISMIIFTLITNILMKNLKLLEQWAMKVSDGDIDYRVEIKTNDEIGRLSDIFNYMLKELKTKFHLEKFVSRSTKNMIVKKIDSPEAIKTGHTGRREYAFLFSDVRGFTAFTEKNDPEVVINIINIYFELQAKIIRSKQGDIDDYVGDQIMAHFGGDKKADTVISVAVKIMKEVHKLNQLRKSKNEPYFEIGIGLHAGEVVVGNVGAGFRMDFTCLGDAVNLTSRLCSHAKPGQILITKKLYEMSTKKYKALPLEPLKVKGKDLPVEVMEIKF